MFACGILESGIRNTAQGIRNPLKVGIQNPRSTDKDWNPVLGIRNPRRGKKLQVILSFGVLVILFNFLLHSWWHHDFRKQGEDLLNFSKDPVKVLIDLLAWQNIWRRYHWFPRQMTSEKRVGRNSILTTRHYSDLDSASDWLNQISHAARPIRSTIQI